ncbi:MAG: GNAT family N-acetyltransferase [Thermobacillus sp.]|uniref:GNAT family N-acetyltransferase n=1 Tax=Thermobacillus sp. TaxID=2108467 RepID=UPI000E3B2707|nr:GNAT family N-acetyltransferase [Thermobacillus sp.]REK52589.1 MAG: GNAT family N-acetyltransferase [Thermobacillus sp.]
MKEQGIRRLTDKEVDDSIRLSSFAFQFSLNPEVWEQRRKSLKPDRVWGYFIDGRLAAKAAVHPMRIWLNGRSIPMGGIAGVATWPEFRRQGLVRQLLLHVLGVMRDEGVTVSFLHPFSIPFYRKFGWEVVADAVVLELQPEKCGGFAMEGGMRRIERPLEELGLLHRLRGRYAARFNTMNDRDADWWEERVLANECCCYIYEDASGEPQGYMLFTLKDRLMHIAEWVYLNREAREGMLAFIANHDSMADKVQLKCSANDRLPFLLHDPRFTQTRMPHVMGRIVDVQSFVYAYAFRPGNGPTRLRLRITDEAAPWNDGEFLLSVDADGRGSLTPAAAGSPDAPALACHIRALSAVLLGDQRPASLYEDGLFTGDAAAAELLESRVPATPTNLIDFF